MDKTIIIAGKELPKISPYISSANENNRNVVCALKSTETMPENTSKKFAFVPWTRPSPISARSIILQAENIYTLIDETLLIFDAFSYVEEFKTATLKDFSQATDNLILSYSFIVTETIQEFTKKKHGRLIFLLKPASTPAHPLKGQEQTLASIPLCLAQAAFEALAENVAALLQADKYISVALFRAEGESDQEIASWLYPFLNSNTEKKFNGWIRVGSRGSGLFSLFK